MEIIFALLAISVTPLMLILFLHYWWSFLMMMILLTLYWWYFLILRILLPLCGWSFLILMILFPLSRWAQFLTETSSSLIISMSFIIIIIIFCEFCMNIEIPMLWFQFLSGFEVFLLDSYNWFVQYNIVCNCDENQHENVTQNGGHFVSSSVC